MQSLLYAKTSDGTANASLMTVQTLRSPGASTILVNTVSGVPAGGFYASMGQPHTFTDPITSEVITVISDATAVDFAGHINAGQIIIDAIAPGYVDTRGSLVGDIIIIRPVTEWANNIYNVLNQSLNNDGTIKTSAITYQPSVVNYVTSGAVVTGLAYGSTLTASLSVGIVWINGLMQTISAVATRTYTANKDTYVDALYSATGVATIVYTEVANGAASPTLAANSIRLAKVITGANIAAATSIIQWGTDTVTTTGQLNYIYNTSPTAAPVFTLANAGTAGGRLYYKNQNGVKELWAIATGLTINTSSSSYTFTLPVGFFNSIQFVSATIADIVASPNQSINVNSQNTTTITVQGYCVTTATGETIEILVRGT